MRVRAELAALRAGVTAAAWLTDHPRDTLALFSRALEDDRYDEWCARATGRESLPGGVVLQRHAYFMMPEAPADLTLPADGAAPTLARTQCTLAVVWVESPPLPGEHPSVTIDRLITDLRAVYGAEGRPDDELVLFGSAYWKPFVAWRAGPATVLAAYDQPPDIGATERLIAIAFLPASNIASSESPEATGPDWNRELAERAAGLAGAPPADLARFVALLREAGDDIDERPSGWGREVAAALRTWIEAARGRPAAQRAAALLAADFALGTRALGWSIPNDSLVREQLTPVGATFEYSHLGGGHGYSHGLLVAALAVDSTGPVGDLALMGQLHRGFDLTGMCSAGDEEFRKVIAAGEPLVARLEGRDKARVHFLLGNAYADIVGLADGSSEEYADAAAYAAEARAARTTAIGHYRRGLALEHQSPAAREAWIDAWRLLAGLPPRKLRYYCIYD